MKRSAFILLFIILSGLVIVPARAETSYYAVSFTGSGQVSIGTTVSFTDGATVVILFKTTSTGRQALVDARTDTYVNGGAGFNLFIEDGKVLAGIGNGTAYVSALSVAAEDVYNTGEILMLTTRFDLSTATIDVFKNGQFAGYLPNVDVSGPITTGSIVLANSPHGADEYPFSGTIYLVLVYNRPLSDEEIQAIYSDPLSPPTDGLVIFYAPDSVDTTQNKWLDKSGQGNDGTIYDASYVSLRPIDEAQFSEARALSFDGVDDYIVIGLTELPDKLTALVIMKPVNVTADTAVLGKTGGGTYELSLRIHYVTKRLNLEFWDGETYTAVWGDTVSLNDVHLIGAVVDYISKTAKLVYDASISDEHDWSQVAGDVRNLAYLRINAKGSAKGQVAEYYAVLIYSRALNSSEIHEIYEHPLDPPKEGLMVYYSPYSYDPESGKWLNLAPILPTIPLSEELDAVNYGAEAVRVSIPDLTVYDAQDGSAIPLENVSVAMVQNNTTTSLLPSLPILPFNDTVTLNVSATGHYPRLITTWTGVNSLAVYLEPVNESASEPEVSGFNSTISAPEEFSSFDPNFIDFESDVESIFTGRYGMLVAALMVIGLVVASLKFHQNPMTSATVLGVAVVYIGTWAYVNWGWLFTLVMMLISAGIMRTFGRWREA